MELKQGTTHIADISNITVDICNQECHACLLSEECFYEYMKLNFWLDICDTWNVKQALNTLIFWQSTNPLLIPSAPALLFSTLNKNASIKLWFNLPSKICSLLSFSECEELVQGRRKSPLFNRLIKTELQCSGLVTLREREEDFYEARAAPCKAGEHTDQCQEPLQTLKAAHAKGAESV